ncbi:MAG: prepilin-type N-terminal cleavage/methylation domain-containing protein [Thiomargarita sp.]|nr:prepilin-type N-terminal cleavage/methylation domain-containing protein [Thiomargarita sp.]
MNSKMNQRGFTLLEAIIALILITSTSMTLFAWINTNLITLQHIQQTYQRHEAIRNALAFMNTVNPTEIQQGKETLGIYTFHWDAEAVTLRKSGKGYYQTTLYDTEVEVFIDERLVADFALRQVGYKQVYEPQEFVF